MTKVLVIESKQELHDMFVDSLSTNYDLQIVNNWEDQTVCDNSFDVVLIDTKVNGIRKKQPHSIIISTAKILPDEDRYKIFDHLKRPIDTEELKITVSKAANIKILNGEITPLQKELETFIEENHKSELFRDLANTLLIHHKLTFRKMNSIRNSIDKLECEHPCSC